MTKLKSTLQRFLNGLALTVLAMLLTSTPSTRAQPLDCPLVDPGNAFAVLDQPNATWYGFDFEWPWVVWRETALGERIMARNLLTGEFRVVSDTAPGLKYNCRVSGGIVLWLEEPSGPASTVLKARDLDGRLWPASEPPRFIANCPHPGGADIGGDWVAYVRDHPGGVGGNVFAQNLHTGELIAVIGPGTKFTVVLEGENLFYTTTPFHVWGFDGRTRDWDVVRYDFTTRSSFPVKVGPGSFSTASVADGRVLLWEVPSYSVPPLRHLSLLDLNTGFEIPVANAVAGPGALAGDLVVYVEEGTRQVMALELSTGHLCPISPGARGGEVAVSHDVVVWQDLRPPASDGRFTVLGQLLLPSVPPDSDGDGVPDNLDACPGTMGGDVVDASGCSIEQLVPCEGPSAGMRWRNHGAYVSAISRVAEEFLAAGLITAEEKDAIVSEAARSDCGRTR